jgi:FkbM family methyltransferase
METNALNPLELMLADAVTLTVPASLHSMTTYVLLEQEAWFEKEMDFLRHWLRPGMTAIDIGANLGVYSLPMARLVGQTGHVFAYEPGAATRALLECSRELNHVGNLHVSSFALSDSTREGRLVFGRSSEFNALGHNGAGETVRVTSLDKEDATLGWPSPDFIKIDAEGEAERILAGGRNFFARHSPLIMFEIKAGDGKVNERLRALFPSIGYRLFRQLGGAPILVPDDARQPLDPAELNLFAAKPERVSTLARQGFLIDAIPAWAPNSADFKNAGSLWRNQKFAPLIEISDGDRALADSNYCNSLAAYATWRAVDRPPAIRCAALAFALYGLREACARAPTAGRLSTLVRVAWEWGARGESAAALRRLLQSLSGEIQLREPFWPASRRFDDIAPGGRPAEWFVAAAAEQFEKTATYTSEIAGISPMLGWLCGQPFASAEMERRHVLFAARGGQRPNVPLRLRTAAVDHLNANVWRAGQVPGTKVEL